MEVDDDTLCRLVVGARLGHGAAASALAALIRTPRFPWYRVLAILHRQGLRAAFAGSIGNVVDREVLPGNVRLELEREAAIDEARSVVAWDRARRVERALAAGGLAVGVRVAPDGDVVRVSVPAGQSTRVAACLAPLGVAGPRPRDGRVNRLEPPAIAIHEESALPPARRWSVVLQRAEAAGVELDAAALARAPRCEEAQPAAPYIPPRAPFAPPPDAREILAVRLGGVGDVHFALPALAAVKTAYPRSRLVLQADTAQSDHLLRRSGSVDGVEPFDWDLRDPDPARREGARARFQSRAAEADLLVVFGPLPALGGIEHGVPCLELRVERGAGHTAAQLLAGTRVLAAGTGASQAAERPQPHPRLRIEDGELEAARARLAAGCSAPAPRPHVAFSLGATTVYKMWPVEHFAALARDLAAETGGTPWVFPHGSEVGLAEELATRAPVECVPGVPLVDLTPLFAACDLVVGNDTGPVHLAAATGTPTLALHGFTDPAFTGPLGPRTATVGGTPSSEPGSEESIREIEPATVLAAIRRLAPDLFDRG